MPVVKVLSHVYETLSAWAVSRGIHPSLAIGFLLEEHSYVVDPQEGRDTWHYDFLPDSAFVRVNVSRRAKGMASDLADTLHVRESAIVSYICSEHMDGLRNSPDAYPGLVQLVAASEHTEAKPPRLTVGIYRPVYLALSLAAHQAEVPTRRLGTAIFSSLAPSDIRLMSIHPDFPAFREEHRGLPYLPVFVTFAAHQTFQAIRAGANIPVGNLASFIIHKQLEVANVHLTLMSGPDLPGETPSAADRQKAWNRVLSRGVEHDPTAKTKA